MTTTAPVEGDVGLGVCLRCLLEHRLQLLTHQADPKNSAPRPPRYAITQAPYPYPVPAPGGGIAGVTGVMVPVCYDHIPLPDPRPGRRPLIVAN